MENPSAPFNGVMMPLGVREKKGSVDFNGAMMLLGEREKKGSVAGVRE